MATLAEVRDIAAEALGRKRLGQGMSDDLKTRLDQSYDFVYAELKDDELTIWAKASGTLIPDGVATHIAALMAFEATSSIKVSNDLMNRIILREGRARPEIRRFVRPSYESLENAENF